MSHSDSQSAHSYEGDTAARDADVAQETHVDQELLQTLFREYSKDGSINGNDLLDILRELEIPTTEEKLRELLVGPWDDIDLETTTDIVQQLNPSNAQIQRTAGKETVTKQIEVLSPWVYLWRKMCCSLDPAIEYRVQMPTMTLHPKEILILSIGAIMLITSCLLIVILSLLWISQTNTAEEKIMVRFGTALSSFITAYEEILMNNNGKEMKDMASELTFFQGLRFSHKLERNQIRCARLGSSVLEVARMDSAYSHEAESETMMHWLKAMNRILLNKGANMKAAVLKALRHPPSSLASTWHIVGIDTTTKKKILDSDESLCALPSSCNLNCPCLSSSITSAVLLPKTIDVQGNGATAVSISFEDIGLRVCATVSQATVEEKGQLTALATIERFRGDIQHFFEFDEISMVRADSSISYSNPQFEFMVPPTINVSTCFVGGTCSETRDIATKSLILREVQTASTLDRSGKKALFVAVPTQYNAALIMTKQFDQLVTNEKLEMDIVFEYLNDIRINLVGTTIELALFNRNQTTGEVKQRTAFAFPDSCYEQCQRSSFALVNALEAYTNKGEGYSISPDYRPEPVMGAYSYGRLDLLGVVLVMERDVTEIRRRALESLVEMVNTMNTRFAESFEIQLLHEVGKPLTMTFDPQALCAVGVVCLSTEEHGVIFRSDCVHCSRYSPKANPQVSHLTELKLMKNCANCSDESNNNLAERAMRTRSEGEYDQDTDYRNEDVIGYIGYIANFSVSFYVKVDYKDVFNPIMQKIYISLGSSIGMVIVALAILMLLSRKLIQKIENEWMYYNEHIQEERKAFGFLVRDLIPAHIAEKAMTEGFLYAESVNCCLAFLDMGGNATRMKEWPVDFVARFLTYTWSVIEQVSLFYDIYRVRMIGDTGFLLSGLTDSELTTAGASTGVEHCSLRMLKFAVNVLQLCTRRFAHFPHRSEVVQKAFGSHAVDFPDKQGRSEEVGNLVMPAFKIGVHYSATSVYIIPNGKTVHFDSSGLPVALTHRIMSTSRQGCIHVTDTVKELVDKNDPDRSFKFAKGKNIILRGRGSVMAYMIAEAEVSLPQEIITETKVRFSKRRHYFREEESAKARDGSVYSISTSSSSKTDHSKHTEPLTEESKDSM